MRQVPVPPDEASRIAALRQTRVLDTAPESAFDQLTSLAAKICGVPVALITLVDVDRQWMKSHQGLDVTETPRDVAFCAYTILEHDLFVVNDALADERFADNPLVVQDPRIRFYAGAPLTTADGHALGSFCVIDYQPRVLQPAQAAALRALGNHAAAMLDLRRVRTLLEVEGYDAALAALTTIEAANAARAAQGLAQELSPLLQAQVAGASGVLRGMAADAAQRPQVAALLSSAQRARELLEVAVRAPRTGE